VLNLKSVSMRTRLFVVFSLVLFAGTSGVLRSLIAYASDWDNNNASQVLMIPLITGTLIYFSRKRIFARVQYDVLPGALLMIAGGALMALGRTRGLNLKDEGDQLAFSVFSILLVWWGGFVLFYGVRAFKTALFPLLFLVFCMPIPSPIMDRTIHFLQHASADVAYLLLKLTGMPIYRDGVLFSLPNMAVEIAPECSGIRSGISLLILSLLTGHVVLRTWPRKLALLLAAIPILIFKNALRISTLSFLAVKVDPRILTSRLHREGGIPFFVVGLLLLYPILRYLIRSELQHPDPPDPPRAIQEVSL